MLEVKEQSLADADRSIKYEFHISVEIVLLIETKRKFHVWKKSLRKAIFPHLDHVDRKSFVSNVPTCSSFLTYKKRLVMVKLHECSRYKIILCSSTKLIWMICVHGKDK